MANTDQADRTLWVGNLDPRATDEILFELFLQAGPVQHVNVPKDRESGKPKNFAFVEFKHDVSVPYSMELMRGLAIFGRPLRLQFRSGSKHTANPNTKPGGLGASPMAGPNQRFQGGGGGGGGGNGILGMPPGSGGGQQGLMPPPIHRSTSAPGEMFRQGQGDPSMGTPNRPTPGMQGPPGLMGNMIPMGLPPGTPFSQGAALQGLPMPNMKDRNQGNVTPPGLSPTLNHSLSTPSMSDYNSYESPERRNSDRGQNQDRSRDNDRSRDMNRRDSDFSPQFDRDQERESGRGGSYRRDERADFRGRDTFDQRGGRYPGGQDFRQDSPGSVDPNTRDREPHGMRGRDRNQNADRMDSPHGFEYDGGYGSQGGRSHRDRADGREGRHREQGRYRDGMGSRNDHERRGYDDGRSHRRNYHSGR